MALPSQGMSHFPSHTINSPTKTKDLQAEMSQNVPKCPLLKNHFRAFSHSDFDLDSLFVIRVSNFPPPFLHFPVEHSQLSHKIQKRTQRQPPRFHKPLYPHGLTKTTLH